MGDTTRIPGLCQRCRQVKPALQAHCTESEQEEVFVCCACWDQKERWHERPFWRETHAVPKRRENDAAWAELQKALWDLDTLRERIVNAMEKLP
jgi:hypothetical protein